MLAALNRTTGQVHAVRQGQITVATLVRFYTRLVAAYPDARRIFIVCDNWPVHYHPDLLAALEPQETPFALRTPLAWAAAGGLRNAAGELVREHELAEGAARQAARQRWHAALPQPGQLPIQLLPLPTYAPWLNPIERTWRKCRQELIHLHRKANDWVGLGAHLDAWFANASAPSPEMLRYCGLLPNQ